MKDTELNVLIRAIDFATVKHSGQRRKNATSDPYINHPIRVMKLLSDAGITDVHILAAAVLHDTVEDTDTNVIELCSTFGEKIASIVMEVTDDKSLSKVARKQGQIDHACGEEMTMEAMLVKLADKLANLSDMSSDPPISWSKEIQQGYLQWSYHVCEPMYGLNKTLDFQLKALFATHGITGPNEEKLQEYYKLLEPTIEKTGN